MFTLIYASQNKDCSLFLLGIMEADTSDLHFVSSELNASIDNKYEIERNNKEPELNAELQKVEKFIHLLSTFKFSEP